MDSRRSLLRGTAELVAGGAATLGSIGGAAARRGGETRADAAADANTNVSGADATTISVDANRTAIRAAGRPATLAPLVGDLERRFDAVSLADLTSATGVARVVDGEPTAGTVAATGSFAADSVRAELRATEFDPVASRTGADRYAAADKPLAVGVTDSRLALEYGAGRRGRSRGSARSRTAVPESAAAASAAGAPALASALDGDLTVTATLDSGTRARLRDALEREGNTNPLATVLERTAAVGASVSIGDGRSDVRYGLLGDEARISQELVRNALKSAVTDADGIESVRVDRRGRAVVVDVGVATVSLLAAQLAALGFDGPFDARSVVGR